MALFHRSQKPLGPPKLWVAVHPVTSTAGIVRLFFKETLDLPDMMSLQQACNRLVFVLDTRAYQTYVAVNCKHNEDNPPVPTITYTVLDWLRQFNQQPPVCNWSLEPEVIMLDDEDLYETLTQTKQVEGLSSERWIVGLH